MPLPPDVENAWLGFVDSIRVVSVAREDDRPLDQFLAFRDAALSLVRSPQFLAELVGAWTVPIPTPVDPRDVLLMEVQAFPRAVEVAQATERPGAEPKHWTRRLLARASTITGSVGDIIENLPPLARGGVKLLGEVADLFKGRGD